MTIIQKGERMSDLISRQAAIDAFDGHFAIVGRNSAERFKMYIEAVINDIRKLPPAQLGTNLAEVGTDTISRKQAIDALRGYLVGKRCPDDGTLTCRLIENEVINKLPSAQPEPKRGKWVLICDNNGMHFICDKCGAWRYHQKQKFCGECGADMREVTT